MQHLLRYPLLDEHQCCMEDLVAANEKALYCARACPNWQTYEPVHGWWAWKNTTTGDIPIGTFTHLRFAYIWFYPEPHTKEEQNWALFHYTYCHWFLCHHQQLSLAPASFLSKISLSSFIGEGEGQYTHTEHTHTHTHTHTCNPSQPRTVWHTVYTIRILHAIRDGTLWCTTCNRGRLCMSMTVHW